MIKYIIKNNQIEKAEAIEEFDMLCPTDLKKYKINKTLYYSWGVFDSWKEADQALNKMTLAQVEKDR